jgi:hypothetical protein
VESILARHAYGGHVLKFSLRTLLYRSPLKAQENTGKKIAEFSTLFYPPVRVVGCPHFNRKVRPEKIITSATSHSYRQKGLTSLLSSSEDMEASP